MGDRLSGAYWKLWHDVRGRFAMSIFLVCATMVGVLAPRASNPRPKACVPAGIHPGGAPVSWAADAVMFQNDRKLYEAKGWIVDAKGPHGTTRKVPANIDLPNEQQLADGTWLSARCAGGYPNYKYAAQLQQYTSRIFMDTWQGTMPLIMLFIGILLAVGPPFSGESMEAFALTFSLPWSREKWLVHKVVMSLILLTSLVLFVAVVTMLSLRFPHTSGLIGWYPGSRGVDAMSFGMPLMCLLLGCVGIALGTVTSLFARNILSATIAAGLIAYLLVTLDIGMPTDAYGSNLRLLPLLKNGTMTTFLLLALSALLVSLRLRRTDF